MLDGDKATKHCAWGDSLRAYPEISVLDERVVVDRNRITDGGITAGLDFALTPQRRGRWTSRRAGERAHR